VNVFELAEHGASDGVEPIEHLVEQLRPRDTQLLIHELLRPLGRLKPHEAVVAPLVSQSGAVHLPRQPLAAVDPDLHREGKPALDPCMDESERRMDLVAVQKQTLAEAALYLEPFRSPVRAHFERGARLNRF
jgi:hypothetical protein